MIDVEKFVGVMKSAGVECVHGVRPHGSPTEAVGRAEKGALCGMRACLDRRSLAGIDSALLYQCLLYQ